MRIQDLLENGNITIAVTASDLKEFAKELVRTAKQELEQQITEANTETYPTTGEVAKLLGVDRTTLWRWNKQGYLSHVEVGGKRKYRMSDVNQILKGEK